jgi:hypothetical protein
MGEPTPSLRWVVLLLVTLGCQGSVTGPGFCHPVAVPVDDPTGVVVQACSFDPVLCHHRIARADSVRVTVTPVVLGQTACDTKP